MARKRNSGGDESFSKRARNSSGKASRQGSPPASDVPSESSLGSVNDSSSSSDQADTPPASPTLRRFPPELRKMIYGHIVPAFLPVRIHTYGGPDLDLLHKIYLNGGENSDKWREVLQFRLASREYEQEMQNELQFLTKRGVTHIRVDMRGDAEIYDFPSLIRPENRNVLNIPSGILDLFKEIQFVVPMQFGNAGADSSILALARFTFSYMNSTWSLTSVDWAPLMGDRLVSGVPVYSALVSKYWKNSTFGSLAAVIAWHQDTLGINIPQFQNLIQIVEQQSAQWLANYTFGRGNSRDLRTFLIAFWKLHEFVNRRATELAPGVLQDWRMYELRAGILSESQARTAGDL